MKKKKKDPSLAIRTNPYRIYPRVHQIKRVFNKSSSRDIFSRVVLPNAYYYKGYLPSMMRSANCFSTTTNIFFHPSFQRPRGHFTLYTATTLNIDEQCLYRKQIRLILLLLKLISVQRYLFLYDWPCL